MKQFLVWYTACALVEAKDESCILDGHFTFIRHGNDNEAIETIISENYEECEEMES